MQRLRVVTYNIKSGIYHPDGLEAIARVIEGTGADVVALQEVDRGTRRSHGRDQAAFLADRVGMPYHCFGAATPWEGGGEYGVALISSHPLEAVEVSQLWVPHGRDVPHGQREPRVALSARLGRLNVTVFVTHLGLGEEQRLRQAEEILERARRTGGEVVVTGDLNGKPDSPEVLLLAGELRDALGDVPEDERVTFPSGDPEKHGEDYMARTIDYILVSRGLEVESARVVPDLSMASDHNPCEALLVVPEVAPSAKRDARMAQGDD